MRVFLDDQPIRTERTTLASAIAAAKAAADARGRIVVEALADGAPAPDEHLANPSVAAGDPYAEEIRFYSEEPRALVRGALLGAATAMGVITQRQDDVAARIHEGKTDEALAALGEVVAAWEQVRRAVVDGSTLIAEPLAESPEMGGRVSSLSLHLNEVKRLLANEDWAGLADEVGGEMSEEARRWREGLERAAGRLGAGA